MPDQVEREEKARRVRKLRRLAGKTGGEYRLRQVGQIREVLFETERDGRCLGHTENYLEAEVPGTELRGLVKKVKITGVQGEMLVGVVL